jgi:hypothetical protein
MNAINYNKSFTKLKITDAVTSDGSLYGDTYKASVNDPATADEAIRDMAAQIKDNEVVMRGIIGNKAVDLIKKYNNE